MKWTFKIVYHSLSVYGQRMERPVEEPSMPSTTLKELQRKTKLYQKKLIISLNVMVHRLRLCKVPYVSWENHCLSERRVSFYYSKRRNIPPVHCACVEQFRSFKEGHGTTGVCELAVNDDDDVTEDELQ